MSWMGHFQVNVDENEIYNEHDYVCNGESAFETDKVFSSREELLDWVRKTGLSIGYVIVIKTSKSNESVTIQCDRSGISVSKKKSTKNTGSKKCGCPFELVGKYLPLYNGWMLIVICETHNHEPALYLEGHSYARKLSENESQLVNDLTQKNVKPRDILSAIKKQNSNNVYTLKTIYNARYKFRMMGKAGKTDMQGVISLLEREGYISYINPNKITSELEDLFYAHPESINIWRAFPHVLLMDATYNTVRYPLPLLEIVGVTPTNMTFCVAFVFMLPGVIVTDRELALINSYNSLFPDSKGLLSTWHINRSVLTRCKGLIQTNKGWRDFNHMWNTLIYSETEEAYAHNLEQLTEIMADSPGMKQISLHISGVIAYLNKHWLIRHKELFVVAWTKRYMHFGNHTTSRVESQHAKLKLYMDSSQSDLERVVSYIHEVVNSQFTGIKASIQESRMVIRHRYDMPHFQNLNRFVSLYALDIIFHEFQRCRDVEIYENCGCQLRTSYGLPCSHEKAMYLYQGQPIPLDAVDTFCTKLYFSPCISLDDDLDCKAELEELDAEFKKQSRAGKKSFLRKMKEIATPSTTSVGDPTTQKTNRERPSCKKTHVEPPLQAQEPLRPTNSSIPKPPRPSNSSFPKQARHAYINQFPKMFHAFIDRVRDVKPDGNCGFRAVAVGLRLHEDEWPTIRHRLLQELDMYHQQYVTMFGPDGYDRVKNHLDFFNIGEFAPMTKWMNMPEIGILIASHFIVILHTITNLGCQTYLPLRSSPPPWYQHTFISLEFVNNDHYVNISLKEGYPVPTVTQIWFYFKSDCATAWITPYMERINNYTQLLNRTFHNINLD